MTTTKTRPRKAVLPAPPRSRHRRAPDVVESWRSLPMALRVLRAFLGITFLYAGIQKFLDPNFLHAGTPNYIGSQLASFAHGSPIAPLLRFLDHVPTLAGVAIALTEIGIGIGTLVGIAPLLMAGGGLLVNLALTLSATWHVHPYFLGSDSMYAVAWLAYLIGLAEATIRRRRAGNPRATPIATVDELGRREFLRGGALAGASVLAAVGAAALAGAPSTVGAFPANRGDRHAAQRPSGTGTTATAGGPTSPSGPSSAPAGTPIADLSSLPVGAAVGFNDPGVGPCALVRLSKNDVVAFSRVCTHAGCLVGYDQSQRLLYCPCHGAEYDPAHGAAVVGGPAPTPLQPVQVDIDRSTGQVILPS